MTYYKKRKLHKIVSSYLEDVGALRRCSYNFYRGSEWIEGFYKHGEFKLYSSSYEIGYFQLTTSECGDFEDDNFYTTRTMLNSVEVLAILNA